MKLVKLVSASVTPMLKVISCSKAMRVHTRTAWSIGVLEGEPLHCAALRATFRLDSHVKNPHTDPFQTPSKLGHSSYPNAPKILLPSASPPRRESTASNTHPK